MVDDAPDGGTPSDPDVDELRARVDELEHELADARGPRRHPVRTGLAIFMGFLACVGIVGSTIAVWARRTLTDTDTWVATVEPLPQDPAVQKVLVDELTAWLFQALDVEGRVTNALPDQLKIVAVPLTSAAEQSVEDAVTTLLNSEQFANVWAEANRVAHGKVVALLSGDTETIQLDGGQITLNLLPLVNIALTELQNTANDVFGSNISIPPITSAEVPSVVREELSQRLGVDLPPDFGQIVLYTDDSLSAVPQIVQLANRGVVALVVLTFALYAGAIATAVSRRRAVLALALGSIGAIVITRYVINTLVQDALARASDPERRDAVSAALALLVRNLRDSVSTLLWILAIVAAVAFFFGPSRPMVLVRKGIADLLRSAGDRTGAVGETAVWVAAHRDALRVGGGAVAVLALFVVEGGFWSLAVILGLAAAWQVAVSLVARPHAPGDDADGPPPSGPGEVSPATS